ncbi:MAG TPA: hypothetical protein H9728_07140 [Candidatus Borkfalkia excrementavium]|uniref:Sporulation protein YqfC n=1 Tax=Candidatus Borkfalkia excrementavium TaxID=2838505 RepID=A0A9D1Z8T0_9FIRM|nr:hypothetical protein [Candidatus Borkfalkia excrementavium]
MRLFEEIFARLAPDEDISFGGIKFVVLLGRAAYFENVKAISSLSDTAVEIALKSGAVRVEGSGLAVRQYSGGDLMLAGNVVKVEKVQ